MADKRPDRRDMRTLGDLSLCVHGGNGLETGHASTGPIRTPIVMANSYHLPYDPSTIDWSATEPPSYTRNGGTNQIGLSAKLAALEHGEDAVALATGVAALHAVFFTLLASGDHVLVSDATYEATWKLWSTLLPKKYGLEATFVDMSRLDEVEAAIRPNTKMLITEVIANPTTKVADIPGLAKIAHKHNALLMVDSTFTPPPVYLPLKDGADLVVHSLTKYINGHGDAMGGAVIGSRKHIQQIRCEAMMDVGGVISPFNAWLITRGSITLPLRMRQHLASAQRLAEFLQKDDRVAFIYYPGLASHPQHELAKKLFGGRGFGAMMAFAVKGSPEDQNKFVSNLRMVTSAVSLGHDESLIVHIGKEGPRVAAYPDEFKKWGHLRFSVGLEDVEDLEADLRNALDATFKKN